MRLIDAKQMEVEVKQVLQNTNPYGMGLLLRWIRSQPTIEAYTEEDVRNAYNDGYSCGMEQGVAKGKAEPVKHGKWRLVECGTQCTSCTRVFDHHFEISQQVCSKLKRCPECGVIMDLEELQ